MLKDCKDVDQKVVSILQKYKIDNNMVLYIIKKTKQ